MDHALARLSEEGILIVSTITGIYNIHSERSCGVFAGSLRFDVSVRQMVIHIFIDILK